MLSGTPPAPNPDPNAAPPAAPAPAAAPPATRPPVVPITPPENTKRLARNPDGRVPVWFVTQKGKLSKPMSVDYHNVPVAAVLDDIAAKLPAGRRCCNPRALVPQVHRFSLTAQLIAARLEKALE